MVFFLGNEISHIRQIFPNFSFQFHYFFLGFQIAIVRTLRKDQPLRLVLNLLFHHFNHSEPIYKSQRIKLLDVIAVCNQLNVNVLSLISITIFSCGRSHTSYLIESKFLVAGN